MPTLRTRRTLHTAQDAVDTKWVTQQWVARGIKSAASLLGGARGGVADIVTAAQRQDEPEPAIEKVRCFFSRAGCGLGQARYCREGVWVVFEQWTTNWTNASHAVQPCTLVRFTSPYTRTLMCAASVCQARQGQGQGRQRQGQGFWCAHDRSMKAVGKGAPGSHTRWWPARLEKRTSFVCIILPPQRAMTIRIIVQQ